MAYMLIVFAENVSSFCIWQSYSHFLQQKYLWIRYYQSGWYHIFSEITYELDIVLTRTFNILTTNELIKQTMFWTTGPRLLLHLPY